VWPLVVLTALHPLGGQVGTAVELSITGAELGTATNVEFDCADLVWKHTIRREAGLLSGVVAIAPGAAPGGHMLRVLTAKGPSTSLLFNVGQYPAMVESDKRVVPALPAEIYGRLDGAADIDQYWFSAKAGERWLFDLMAMDHGSAVEARMMLLDSQGEKIAYNDDRDHFNEDPLIEHTFAKDGVYSVKLDQYRGPRGFTFGKNNAYVLRISALPRVVSVAPLGARRGAAARFVVEGSGLGRVERVYLTELRRAEYARMTYPYTIPIRFRADPDRVARIEGRVTAAAGERLEASFEIPADAAKGLWQLWVAGPQGAAAGLRLEIDDGNAMDRVLTQRRDVHRVEARADEPLHFETLSAQLGGPFLDTVLTLRDEAGKKLAENDDVVAGQGGLLGNPDSSLFYTPKQNGTLLLEVRDRLNRGGATYPYRLKIDNATPSFQLFTTPENPVARAGEAAEIKVHLVREAGFEGEVEIWVEGGPRARFRADQRFEPNADGADMLIPEITLQVPAGAAAGTQRVRIFGKAVSGGPTVEAHTATMIGPIYQGDWNFYRRPVPEITMTVIE
jgi:hypothetical protein